MAYVAPTQPPTPAPTPSAETYGYYHDFPNWDAWWHSGKWCFDEKYSFVKRLPYSFYVNMRNKTRAKVARTFCKGILQVALRNANAHRALHSKCELSELGIDQWRRRILTHKAMVACKYREWAGHCGNESCNWCYESCDESD